MCKAALCFKVTFPQYLLHVTSIIHYNHMYPAFVFSSFPTLILKLDIWPLQYVILQSFVHGEQLTCMCLNSSPIQWAVILINDSFEKLVLQISVVKLTSFNNCANFVSMFSLIFGSTLLVKYFLLGTYFVPRLNHL